ncbi:hypothetical protein EJ08DRAFT_598488 [Tothia fuscella]|uniref:Uncharacterized protein n=1 Tax=Tothia fuscella TaxID=1048955 RepID=A0A9P4TTR0_9PEZI|nr:hypothetical protein EJ08DRAFT_598488 [Tothia fuscella]
MAQWVEIGTKLDIPVVASQPYQDYALVDLRDRNSSRLNKFLPPGEAHQPVKLEDVATSLRSHRVPVYMISGVSGLTSGILNAGFSYIGSRPGSELCRVWNLKLDGFQGAIDGDCGSTIVDRQTHEVYGHVVGSSPLNYAQVVPLTDVIDQIKVNLVVRDISLLEDTGLENVSPAATSISVTPLSDQEDISDAHSLATSTSSVSISRPLNKNAENSSILVEQISHVVENQAVLGAILHPEDLVEAAQPRSFVPSESNPRNENRLIIAIDYGTT